MGFVLYTHRNNACSRGSTRLREIHLQVASKMSATLDEWNVLEASSHVGDCRGIRDTVGIRAVTCVLLRTQSVRLGRAGVMSWRYMNDVHFYVVLRGRTFTRDVL